MPATASELLHTRPKLPRRWFRVRLVFPACRQMARFAALTPPLRVGIVPAERPGTTGVLQNPVRFRLPGWVKRPGRCKR